MTTTHDTQAARDVLAERKRQIEVEGYTPERDGHWHNGTGHLARAAAAYAVAHTDWPTDHPAAAAELFPWSDAAWRPRSPRENLVRAGALILAEIERLDRATT